MSERACEPGDGTEGAAAGFDGLWSELADIGRDPRGGYRRFAYTPAELELREWFRAAAEARHLDVHEDRAGNLWAWWGPPPAGEVPAGQRAVVLGSHLDSVPRGGAFDGPLGVVSSLLAVAALQRTVARPPRPVAVVAFADEEGARFGVACAGSRLLTGQLAPERARALTDDDGVSLAEALRATGRDPTGLGAQPELLSGIGAFVELHVEQGRALVDLQAPVAVGSAIRPHGRWRFDLAGRADHAGTTRLEDRDDPMLAQARLVLAARAAAERRARRGDAGAVATVGRVRVEPNAVNAIPARVQAWLDARADAEEEVRAMVAELEAALGTPAVEESFSPRVALHAPLAERVARAVAGVSGAPPPRLATGAGHDAGILAAAGIPTAMLHVRNPTGISHAPEEHAEVADCHRGVVALTAVLADLVGPGAPGGGQPAADDAGGGR